MDIDIAIIEDDVIYSSNLAEYLSLHGLHIVERATNYSNFLNIPSIDKRHIDIIILDINLADGEIGLEGIEPLKKRFPQTEIVILTTHDDSMYVFKALISGAIGFLIKGMSLKEILDSIKIVKDGGSVMTPSIARKVVQYFSSNIKTSNAFDKLTGREYEVVEGIKDGLSYKMIADRCEISIETVRYHVKNIYRKLQVNSKSEVVNLYYKNK